VKIMLNTMTGLSGILFDLSVSSTSKLSFCHYTEKYLNCASHFVNHLNRPLPNVDHTPSSC